MSQVEERVKDLIDELSGISGNEIVSTDRIEEDLCIDELDKVELMMSIEDEFVLDGISDEDTEKIKTVQDLVDYVEKNKQDE